MSKKKTQKTTTPITEKPEETSDSSRRSRDIASFYSEEMSKEAVGSLFKDYVDEKTDEPRKPDHEKSSDDTDKEYIEYMKSYSKHETRKSDAKKGISDTERVQLNKSATRRTTTLSLGSKDGGTTATLHHDKSDHSEDDFAEDRFEASRSRGTSYQNPFIAFVMTNLQYISLGVLALFLVIFVSLIITINGLNGKLKEAGDPASINSELNDKYNNLLIASEGKDDEIDDLTTELDALKAQVASGAASTPTTDPSATTAPSSSAQPANATAKPGSTNVPSGTIYVVEESDTPWSIAVKFYGNGSYFTKILEANQLTEKSILKIGMELKIPQ